MKKNNKENEYFTKLSMQIGEMFDDQCENKIDLQELQKGDNLTIFFHCLATLVPAMFYNKFTGNDEDALSFNHIANRLTFQFSKSVDDK